MHFRPSASASGAECSSALCVVLAAIVWVCVTVNLKCSAMSCAACCRARGGTPSSSIIICGEVKQCRVRCSELMTVGQTTLLWAGPTLIN